MKKISLRNLTMTAMFAAIAYVVMLYCRVSLIADAPYLQYDPKDIIIVIASFILGPIEGMLISVVVSFLEMITTGGSGPIGMLMNIIATFCFILPASIIYKRKKTFFSATIGLLGGVIGMTAAMLLWNYLITPIYQGVPREVITGMLIPIFLPFNLIKSCINMGVTLVLYKPVILALKKAGIMEQSTYRKKSRDEKKSDESRNKAISRTV